MVNIFTFVEQDQLHDMYDQAKGGAVLMSVFYLLNKAVAA